MSESERVMTKEKHTPTVEVLGLFSETIDSHGNISSHYSSEQAKELGLRLANEFTIEAKGTGCVCIDGRKCSCMADGSEAFAMSKMAGGNGLAVWVATELSQTLLFNGLGEGDHKARLNSTVNCMNELGEEVYGHSSTMADDESTNECGAAMSLPKALEILDTQRDQVAGVMKAAMGDLFDSNLFESLADNSKGFKARLDGENYTGTVLTDVIYETQGQDHVEKLESDDSPTHNHLEEAVVLDFRPGVTLDRDAINDSSDMPQVFSVDVDAIIARAKKYSSSPDEQSKLLHAMIAMQVATYAALCDGTHPIIVIK